MIYCITSFSGQTTAYTLLQTAIHQSEVLIYYTVAFTLNVATLPIFPVLNQVLHPTMAS